MRLISIDTETTGSSPPRGDRCVEVGAVEILDGRLTGQRFQTYLNPGRPVDWQARRVHGLTDRFLADKPRFGEVAGALLDFIGDAPCLAHNARFDRDMLLHDFRGAGLQVPPLRFYDTVPFTRALVKAPAYRLDVLAMTLGVIEQGRGLHGALEDAEILARVICRIEADRPGALRLWVRGSNALSPLPKGWSSRPPVAGPAGSAPEPGPSPAVSAGPLPAPGPRSAPDEVGPEERREAVRIADLVRAALEGSPDLPLFAERLGGSGVLLRPVVNGDLTLHGVRFSTPLASFTGGAIGLTGSVLERAGVAYRPEHAPLVERLTGEHDAVMGPVTTLRDRFRATPTPTGAAMSEAARERVRGLIADALPGATSIFDLADRLERVGVITQTRLDVRRMRVSSVLFVGGDARVPGPRVGLGPGDMGPEFWSIASPGPVRRNPDGSVTAPPAPRLPPRPDPVAIGDGLNEGVAQIIADLNARADPLREGDVPAVRCGTDAWSRLGEERLWDLLLPTQRADRVERAVSGLSDPDRVSALRWMCRGLAPEQAGEFHRLRSALYEARRGERPSGVPPGQTPAMTDPS